MKLIRYVIICIITILIFSTTGFAVSNDIQFSQIEKDFIKEHPVIYLGIDPAFIPFEFIDSDGQYKGIAADYIQLICERTGLEMVIDKDLTWSEAYEKGVQKQLDVLPCISKTAQREKYFLFSDPYYSFQRVIFINENNNSIKSLNDLLNKKVAVQINSSHNSFLNDYDSIEQSLYFNVDDALKAVSIGKEIAYVGNLATSSYLIKSNGITNLKFIVIEPESNQSLYFAVRNDWPELVSIINKSLENITQEEKINISNHWVAVKEETDYAQILKIGGIAIGVIAIILIVSFFWISKLRREISVRQKIQEELKIARDEAESANHIKSTFLARMSHEIRTPLNAITGMAYLIKKTDVTITQQIYLDKITQASRNMLTIINDILDFSRIEAGKVEIERISFNLDKVLKQVIDIVSFKIEEQGIDFSMNKDCDIPAYFWGDPTRIEQILLNVVNNAIKFTDKGSVFLSIRLMSKEENVYNIEFSVKDTGIGMTSEQINQLFKPFDQGDSSINRRFGGSGLGLSIVKNLVDLMGGDIQVYSSLGEGSTFNIGLDLEADLSNVYEENKKLTSTYFQNIHVLVVQKNNNDSNLLNDYLNSFNLYAEFASTGDSAMQLIKKASAENKTYNLLIIDNETPEEGGIEFFSKIKNQSFIKEVPKCILIIPLLRDDFFEKLKAAKIDFGITKPIVPSILYNAIVEIFKIEILETHDSLEHMAKQGAITVEYPYHVLIVEDNKTNQFIAKSILEQSGFKVSLADNGLEGYEFFATNQKNIDLILMDIQMPVLNGIDSTILIRKIDDDIPIIAMTADAIAGVEEMCKEAGINYYVSKPFEPDLFVETILHVIQPLKEKVKLEEVSEKESDFYNVKSVLDEMDGIKRVGGKLEIYYMVLEEYYKENKDIPSILNDKIEKQNYEEAIKIVHKIKSSSGSIGAKSLHEVAMELQKSLCNKDVAGVLLWHKKFQKILNQLLIEIEDKISTN